MDDRRRGFPVLELLDCRHGGHRRAGAAHLLERETGKVRLDVLNPSWIIFGEGFRNSIVQRALERGLDGWRAPRCCCSPRRSCCSR